MRSDGRRMFSIARRRRERHSIERHGAVVAALVFCAATSGAAAEITPLERQRLAAHLEMTGAWLADEVSNLSQQQLEFRRAPGSWSILEVLDHLVVVGAIYWEDLQKAVRAGPRT